MTERYADVILNISHESVDRPFTYIIPEDLRGKLTPGTAVQVPFGNAKEAKLGYVLSLRKEAPSGFQLREILGVAEKKLGVEEGLLSLAVWMHEHYGCMLNQALKTVLPVKEAVRARKQKIAASAERTGAAARELTAEQSALLSELGQAEAEKPGGSYLLFGVTGSGKTEVYMRCIEEQRSRGKQAILLLPEINLTFQTVRYLEERFGGEVAIIHSKLAKGERYRQFLRAARGEASVMVGPRSALFAPFPNLGLIIIDEEHDGAYRNDAVPRYDTREVAAKRAELAGAQLILGSATPSVESWRRAETGEYRLLRLTRRAVPGAVPARATVADLRKELKRGNRTVFSETLREKIESCLSRREQVMLFMNRRGYARFLSCRSCGEPLRCPHCDVSLTYHEDGSLRCHYCGYKTVKPERCPSCGSPYIAGFGMGTQQLAEQTKRMFPAARVLRMDADAVRGKDGGQSILERFRAKEADILVGNPDDCEGARLPECDSGRYYGGGYRTVSQSLHECGALLSALNPGGRPRRSRGKARRGCDTDLPPRALRDSKRRSAGLRALCGGGTRLSARGGLPARASHDDGAARLEGGGSIDTRGRVLCGLSSGCGKETRCRAPVHRACQCGRVPRAGLFSEDDLHEACGL